MPSVRSRRYERGALLVTPNRAIGEWGAVFGGSAAATAILDRLLHRSHIITIRGESGGREPADKLSRRPAAPWAEKLRTSTYAGSQESMACPISCEPVLH